MSPKAQSSPTELFFRPTRLWVALAILVVSIVLGETLSQQIRRIGWTAYGAETSALRGTVQDVAAGPDELVWAATSAGVTRFDGSSWISAGLEDQDVRNLAAPSAGGLWAYTAEGAFSFDGQAWRRYRRLDLWLTHLEDAASEHLHRPLATASDGTLWAGVEGGLLRFRDHLATWSDPSRWTTIDLPEVLAGAEVLSLAVGPDDVVWVGTERGLARWDGTGWTVTYRRDGLPHSRVQAVAVSAEGTIWVGTRRGLARSDGEGWQRLPYGGPGRARSLTAIAVSDAGELWAGTRRGVGVWDVDSNRWLWVASFWSVARPVLWAALVLLSGTLFWQSPWRERLSMALAVRGQRWVLRIERIRLRSWGPRLVAAVRGYWTRLRSAVVDASTEQRLHWAILACIVLFGLVLRLWRLDFGQMLPYVAHADEWTQYNPAIRILQTGDLNPRFFNYPSLTIYIDALVLYAGSLVGRLLGLYEGPADLAFIEQAGYGRGLVDTPEMLLLGRATTAVLGMLTLLLVYVLARNLYRREWLSLAAVALLAVSDMHIRLSHYMTVDVFATFFTIACLLGCTLYLSKKKLSYLWLGALCGGLATSCKYNYAVLAIPVALSVWLDPRLWPPQQLKRLWISGLLFCLAFVLTSPYVLLDATAAFEDIEWEMEHYATGHLGQAGNSFVWYGKQLWSENPLYLILGLPGFFVLLGRRRRIAVPLVLWCVLYAVLIGVQKVHMGRNALPVLVLLVVGVGSTIDALVAWLHQVCSRWIIPGGHPYGIIQRILSLGAWRISIRGIPVRLWVLLLACAPLVPALPVVRDVFTQSGPSAQALAQAWIAQTTTLYEATAPTRPLRIAAEGYTVYLAGLYAETTYIKTASAVGPPEVFREQGYDVVFLGAGMYNRFYGQPEVFADEVAVYDAFIEGDLPHKVFRGPDDPLGFASGRTVYAFFLTPEAVRAAE